MRLVGGKPTEPVWLYVLAGALMLGGPVWRELYFHHYPARPEAFLLPLIAGTVGAIVAVGSRVAGGLLGAVTFGGLLFVFTDLQFDPQHWTYMAVVLGGCIALAQLFASRRAAISALSLGAFYLTSLARPAVAPRPVRLDTTGTARSTSPLLVHVVFDAQWGVGGLRAAGDTLTAEFLKDFYLTRGFELYEAAYSRYMETDESLRSVMLLGRTQSDSMPPRRGPYAHSIQRNPYFGRLHELGYVIRVDQSTYIDFCNGDTPVVSCEVRSGNSIANVGFLDGSWVPRGVLASQYFLSTRSHIFARLFPGHESWRRALAGGGLAALRHLSRSIAIRPSGGNAWFVHVLFPHRPFQADEECRVQTDPSRYLDYDLPAHPSDSLWRAALSAYADQVRCAHRALAEVIETIDSTVGREHSIVIVQGDHGSRMHSHALHDPQAALEAYTAAELNSHFATLLAVRRPQVPASLHGEPTPIQDVIWELARSDFRSALPATWPHYVSKLPYRAHPSEQVRLLSASDMPWARQPD